ncbi:MAG: HNH endonuclease [Acidobacteria bacterium]|nr:HNH endonuclease [Acidobacteriota bacterium]
MLLALIDMVAEGKVADNRFPISTVLVEAFLKYWNLVRLDKPAIHLPLYHLQTDGIWRLIPLPDSAVMRFGSMAEIKKHIAFGRLDDDLFALLLDPVNREAIRESLIRDHFPDDAGVFRAATGADSSGHRIEDLLEIAATESRAFARPRRSPLFRSVIMRLYDFTCAACRHRVVTIEGVTAAEAAHIIPFSVTQDDRAGNGMALCKLHHWAFDAGLLSVDDGYGLLVSDKFEEQGEATSLFAELRRRSILLPSESAFRPSNESLEWHRSNRFQN